MMRQSAADDGSHVLTSFSMVSANTQAPSLWLPPTVSTANGSTIESEDEVAHDVEIGGGQNLVPAS